MDTNYFSRSGLRRPRSLLIAGAVTAATAALAVSQGWITTANLLSLVFVLPCAAMMLRCTKHANSGPQTDTETVRASKMNARRETA